MVKDDLKPRSSCLSLLGAGMTDINSVLPFCRDSISLYLLQSLSPCCDKIPATIDGKVYSRLWFWGGYGPSWWGKHGSWDSQSQWWDPEPKALHTFLGLSSQKEQSQKQSPTIIVTHQVNSVLQRACLLHCPIASGTSTTSWDPCIQMQETVGDI